MDDGQVACKGGQSSLEVVTNSAAHMYGKNNHVAARAYMQHIKILPSTDGEDQNIHMMLSVMMQHFKILPSTDGEDQNIYMMLSVMMQHIKILPSTDGEDQNI